MEVVGTSDGFGIDRRPLVGWPERVRDPPARCVAYVFRHGGSIRPRRRIAFSEILCRVAMSERRFDTGLLGLGDGLGMNSWKSSEFWACAPPLMTFIIGTGSTWALVPPIHR